MTIDLKAIRAAADFEWVCNECGSHEFTSSVSRSDLDYLACNSCGCNEFHKEPVEEQK